MKANKFNKNQAYIVVDHEIIVDVSMSFLTLTQYSKEALLTRNIRELFRLLRVGPSIDLAGIDADREYFLFTKSMDCRFVNIDVLENAYVFLEKPGSRLDVKYPGIEAMSKNTHFGIAIYSMPDLILLRANQTYLGFLDNNFSNPEKFMGKKIYEIISNWDGSSFEDICKYIQSTQKPYYIDEVPYESDRGITYWNLSLTPVFENGSLKYCIEVSRNITERVLKEKMIEEQAGIIAQQKAELEKLLEMKDEFLMLISHEFRTPLNVINTAIQCLDLIRANEMSGKVKEYMQIIQQNTNRQIRLVNNLLDITRANSNCIKLYKKNTDIVFLTKSIIESVNELAAKKGVMIIFESNLANKIIGIDDQKYERIILNLLSNAIKFAPEGTIAVSLRSLKGMICIEVKDSGIGIQADKIDVIFDKFGQVDSSLSRQAEGTGIGLTLVKKFVEELGGSISVKSKLGKGTTFKILLPDEKIAEEPGNGLLSDPVNDIHIIEKVNIELSDIYF